MPARRKAVTGQVVAGDYVLEVGNPAGTLISPAPPGERADPRTLAQALDAGGLDEPRRRTAGETAEAAVEDAALVTEKVERALTLFTEVAEGRLDQATVRDELGALMDLVDRLDEDGRFDEALRLARSLSGLLALLARWVELAHSLHVALRAAQQLGDSPATAWTMHELGTLHLGAGQALDAEEKLSAAQRLREELGDKQGLAATEKNLQVQCRQLRQMVREGRLVPKGAVRNMRPMALAAGAIALLAMGGVAGAVIDSSGDGGSTVTALTTVTETSAGISGQGGVEPEPKADLVVAEIVVKSIRHGDGTCTVPFVLRNVGEASAPESTSSVSASTGSQPDISTVEVPAGPLAPGAREVDLAALDVSCESGMTITVIADPLEAIDEVDEENNQTTAVVPSSSVD